MIRTETLAALDLGTNTIKLTVARCLNGEIEELHAAVEVVRIGKAIGRDGRISAKAIDRTMQALIDFERIGRQFGASDFIGVATQALRVATNGAELISRIAVETGWNLSVISGEEEARLTFDGLRNMLPKSSTGLIVDIGGGSTELILATDQIWVEAESHPVGSGNLTDRFLFADPPTASEVQNARKHADDVLNTTKIDSESEIDQLLLAGGAGQFLDQLSTMLRGSSLSRGTLPLLVDDLTSQPADVFAAMLGIPTERARVLPGGHQIAMSVLTRFKPLEILAVPSGIRTGIISRRCSEVLS